MENKPVFLNSNNKTIICMLSKFGTYFHNKTTKSDLSNKDVEWYMNNLINKVKILEKSLSNSIHDICKHNSTIYKKDSKIKTLNNTIDNLNEFISNTIKHLENIIGKKNSKIKELEELTQHLGKSLLDS